MGDAKSPSPTMVPSLIFCCSAGLRGSPPGCGEAPQVEATQAPGADPAGVWRIGECLVRTTPKPSGPGWVRAAPWVSATGGAGGGPAPAGRGGSATWPCPCALCSWRGTGAGLRNTWSRACRTCGMPRPPCERRPSGSSVSHRPRSVSGQPGPSPRRCAGSEEQPWGCRSPGCPVRGLGLPLPPCPRRWAWGHLAQPPLAAAPPGGHPAEGVRACSPGGRARGFAAGKVLGSGGSDAALCLGLAARPLGKQNRAMLCEMCSGE